MNFKKKTGLATVLALVMSLSLTHCEFLGLEDDDSGDNDLALALLLGLAASNGCTGTSPVTLSGEITSDLNVRCGILSGTVFVRSGATLTVPAGGQIFGSDGSSLFILPGARLNALGTAAQPVVFTSAQATGNRRAGDWGGIVIIGNASTNRAVAQTEGTNPQNYGGPASNNDADNSGILNFVRIEYAGDTVAVGNELNCLSMYAVGNGTSLRNVQCHKGRDDSFEWFGGSVDGKFLVSTGVSDDDFDMDEGYHGRLQHLIAYKFPDGSSGVSSNDTRGFEFDGVSSGGLGGAYGTPSLARVANFTIVGSNSVFTDAQSSGSQMIRVREGTTGHIAHGFITGFGADATSSKEIRCDAGAGDQAGTNVAFYSTFTQAGTTINNTAACTTGGINTATVPSTGFAITAQANVTTGTAPNLIPTVGVTGQTALTAVNGVFNDGFFDNTTYAGAIDPGGADWSAGWTNWLTN